MRYYGQFNPPVDKIIHTRYFPSKEGGVAIEAGAFDGVTESSTYFFNRYRNWTTYNIEPLPNVFETLEKNRPDPRSINLNLALSSENTTQTIRNYRNPTLGYDWGNASLSHTPDHKRQLEALSNNTFVEHTVQCITYRQLIERYRITHVDLFVLDVEGHESEVLQGMVGEPVLPDVFVIEHGHSPVNLSPYFGDTYILDTVSAVNSFFVKKGFYSGA